MKKSQNLIKRLHDCPVEAFLKLIGQRWSSYILVVLLKNGGTRFGQLKKLIPLITSKVLTDKLRELETSGLVSRDHQPTIPPKVTYELTKLGYSLSPLLNLVSETAHKWRKDGII
jgi:DNA-binding HxlR family transcriptional regulator